MSDLVQAAGEDEVGAVLAALIEERGGRQCFSVPALVAARKLARLLCSDQAVSPAVSALLQMLPPLREGPPVDLSRLADRELDDMEFLIRKAQGEVVTRPRRTPRAAITTCVGRRRPCSED
jgi:hypothetical protein